MSILWTVCLDPALVCYWVCQIVHVVIYVSSNKSWNLVIEHFIGVNVELLQRDSSIHQGNSRQCTVVSQICCWGPLWLELRKIWGCFCACGAHLTVASYESYGIGIMVPLLFWVFGILASWISWNFGADSLVPLSGQCLSNMFLTFQWSSGPLRALSSDFYWVLSSDF